jgi:hypothetical protein
MSEENIDDETGYETTANLLLYGILIPVAFSFGGSLSTSVAWILMKLAHMN